MSTKHVVTIERFKKDIMSKEEQTKEYQYLFRSRINLFIINEIGVAMCRKVDICFEGICEAITKRLGSRSSILSILNEGVERSYLCKSVSREDRRLRVYCLSSDFFELWKGWVERLGEGYREVG